MSANIDDLNPTIICLAETHLENQEKIEITGYKLYRLDETSYSGGIIIGVQNTIKTVVVELKDYSEIGWIKWILINNGRIALRLGVVYAPQENVTPVKELKRMYKEIEENAEIAQRERQMIVVVGDFNCKIGKHIKGNKETVTKGGRLLLKMVRKNNLKIVNASNKTKGI